MQLSWKLQLPLDGTWGANVLVIKEIRPAIHGLRGRSLGNMARYQVGAW
jgi:hypothetical protein